LQKLVPAKKHGGERYYFGRVTFSLKIKLRLCVIESWEKLLITEGILVPTAVCSYWGLRLAIVSRGSHRRLAAGADRPPDDLSFILDVPSMIEGVGYHGHHLASLKPIRLSRRPSWVLQLGYSRSC
jgi:hypothetical protein